MNKPADQDANSETAFQQQSGDPALVGSGDDVAPRERPGSDCDNSWQEIECRLQQYNMIAEWIRFADAKAAVVLTVSGAAAGFIIPTINKVLLNESTSHWIPGWKPVVVTLFAGYLLFFLLSNVMAFLCINPFRKKGIHPSLNHCDHFHPSAISARFGLDEFDRFRKSSRESALEKLQNEIPVAILLDSHISTLKYSRVRSSLFLFAVSVVFGFLYYLTAQL